MVQAAPFIKTTLFVLKAAVGTGARLAGIPLPAGGGGGGGDDGEFSHEEFSGYCDKLLLSFDGGEWSRNGIRGGPSTEQH